MILNILQINFGIKDLKPCKEWEEITAGMIIHDQIQISSVLKCVVELSDPGTRGFSHDIPFFFVKWYLENFTEKDFK